MPLEGTSPGDVITSRLESSANSLNVAFSADAFCVQATTCEPYALKQALVDQKHSPDSRW